jgi:hypothetical protein
MCALALIGLDRFAGEGYIARISRYMSGRMAVMRQWQALLLGLLAAPLAGCLTPPKERAGPRPADVVFQGPTGPDVVQMDVALIERPADDPYLVEAVWQLADEQKVRRDGVVDLEHKGLLGDNGFRVGSIAGAPPGELRRLVGCERSCVNPRRLTLHSGKPTPVLLGPAGTHCEFALHRAGKTTPVELDLATCQLEVTPLVTEEGRTQLHFTPVVKHGEVTSSLRPALDADGSRRWALEREQTAEAYSWLSWDLSVGPSEYVLIGARAEQSDTLGACSFVSADGATPVRRLLVLRVGRALPEAASSDESSAQSRPLALQAAYRKAQ